jgi:hypothetical protein
MIQILLKQVTKKIDNVTKTESGDKQGIDQHEGETFHKDWLFSVGAFIMPLKICNIEYNKGEDERVHNYDNQW